MPAHLTWEEVSRKDWSIGEEAKLSMNQIEF